MGQFLHLDRETRAPGGRAGGGDGLDRVASRSARSGAERNHIVTLVLSHSFQGEETT